MPKFIPDYTNSLSAEALSTASYWLSIEDGEDLPSAVVKSILDWSSQQKWYEMLILNHYFLS
jgi:hypothetical protein